MNGSFEFAASEFRRDAGDRNSTRGNNLVDLLDQYDREKFQAMVKANNAHVEVKVLPDLELTNGSQRVFQPMHVVEPGESLWSIARKELREAGLASSDRDVANEVKRIIEVNSHNYPSLKNNPNLIQKGWILELPSELQFDAARAGTLRKANNNAEVPAQLAGASKTPFDNKEFGKLSPYEKDMILYSRAQATGKMFPRR